MRSLILNAITFLGLMSNASAACRLSDIDRANIKKIGAAFVQSSFQNKVLSESPCCHGIEDGTRFPTDSVVSSLADMNGQLLLFRGIQTDYVARFASPFSRVEANSYSYSLSPAMPIAWPYTKVVIVALQNVVGDGLMYPKVDFKAERARVFPLLHPLTRTGDIAQYDEIKVPIDTEKVILQIDVSSFRDIVDSFQNRNYSLSELLTRLAESSQSQNVDCNK